MGQVNPAMYFTPTLDQERIIHAVGSINPTKTPIVTILSGFPNGCGKTLSWAMIVGNLIRNTPQSHWFDYSIFRSWPFAKSIRIITNPTQLMDTGAVHVELENAIGGMRHQKYKHNKTFFCDYQIDETGWTIDLLSNNQAVGEAESVTRGMIIMDEPCPVEFWQASVTRLRGRGGIILIAATLIGDHADWIDEEIIRREDKSRIIVLQGSLKEACKEHGVRGFRPHDEIEAQKFLLEGSMTATSSVRLGIQLSARTHGAVFPEFSEGVHVTTIEQMPPLHRCTIRHAIDPHDQRPFAAIWWATDENGTHYIFAEWPEYNLKLPYHEMTAGPGMDGHVRAFQTIEAKYGVLNRISDMYIDGRFGNRPNQADVQKRTLQQILNSDFARSYRLSNNHPKSRGLALRTMHDLLTYGVPNQIRPRLMICKHCGNTIRSMVYHRWRRNASSLRPDELSNVEDQKYKDFVDAAMIGLEYDPPYDGPMVKAGEAPAIIALPPGVRSVAELRF